MKALPVSTPTVFIMIGIPGSGKTHFANAFAQHYGLPLVTMETIAASLPDSAQHITNDYQAAVGIGTHLAQEFLKTNTSFIIDSAHVNNRIERMKLQRMAAANNYQTVAVWVQVDEPSARQRSLRPRDSGQPLDERRFMDAVKNFTAPTTERYAVVSGKHTFSAQRNAVLHKIQPSAPQVAKPTASTVPTPVPSEDTSDIAPRHIPAPIERPIPSRRINIR